MQLIEPLWSLVPDVLLVSKGHNEDKGNMICIHGCKVKKSFHTHKTFRFALHYHTIGRMPNRVYNIRLLTLCRRQGDMSDYNKSNDAGLDTFSIITVSVTHLPFSLKAISLDFSLHQSVRSLSSPWHAFFTRLPGHLFSWFSPTSLAAS